MGLSDARHNINSLVVSGAKVEYDEELWDLFRKSWRLIQEELNKSNLLKIEKKRRDYEEFLRTYEDQMGR